MELNEAYDILAHWLLTQNSSAAAWLAKYPQLFMGLETTPGKPGAKEPPPLREPFDEETAQADLRLWLGREMVSQNLAALGGRSRPSAIMDRLAGSVARAVDQALVMADRSLRERFNHPLLLPLSRGLGPVTVLAWGPLAGREAAFNQAVGLFFLFSRSPGFAGPRSEEDLDQARSQSKQMIILREYVLKAAGRVLTFLGLEHPAGPALSVAPPEGWSQALIGTQINSMARFTDFFQHKADLAQLFSLTRMTPLAGQKRLGQEVVRQVKRILLERFSERTLIAETLSRLRARPQERFDPTANPGGLADLGRLVDGLLLSKGVWAGRTTGRRLKKAEALGLLNSAQAADLNAARESLLQAHLVCSALDQHPPGPTQYEAALALWPRRKNGAEVSLAAAREIVSHALDRFIQEG